MRYLFTLLLMAGITPFVNSQSAKITGTVTDPSNEPVPFANVVLKSTTDSSFVKGEISDESGNFVMEHVKYGSYFVQITAQTFDDKFVPLEVNEAEIEMSSIQLSSIQEMEGVQVKATRPFMTMKADRIVVHVEASPASQGNTAWELLGKLPGVTILDGNIVLRGKGGVQVTVNDKLLRFGGSDLENYLKSIHASQIRDIEVISNPPAHYDAQGNSGIINIILAKPAGTGFQGSIASGYGRGLGTHKTYTTLSLSNSGEKGNLLFSLSGNYNEFFNNLTVQKTFFDGDSTSAVIRNNNRIEFQNYSTTARLNYDWFQSEKSVISFLASGAAGGRISNGVSNSEISDGQDLLNSLIEFQSGATGKWFHYSGNVHWTYSIDTTGQKFSLDLDAAGFDNRGENSFDSFFADANKNPMDTLSESGNQLGLLNILSFKADYNLPLKKEWQFDAGVKSSYVTSDQDVALYFDGDLNQLDTVKSNHFLYDENINAAYINFSKTFKKLSTQFGLRMEQTNAKGNQLTTGETFDLHYAQLFPTVFLNYKMNDKHSISLNAGRRINRPRYQQLNPFIRPIDGTSWHSGNPNLQPEFTYNSEFTYSFKNQLFLQASYSYTNQGIITVLAVDPVTQITLQMDDNVDKRHDYSLALIYNKPIKKWWHLSANLTGFYTQFDGSLLGFYFNRSMPTFYGSLSNTFSLKHGIRIEQGYTYMHYNLYGTTLIKPQQNLTIGVRKSLFKGKGSIAFNVSDLLWTHYPRGIVDFNGVEEIWSSQRDSRSFYLHFRYRFGKGKQLQMRRDTGADEEKGRAN